MDSSDKTEITENGRAAGNSSPSGEIQRLGHYRIIGKLGKGGMGVVYLGEDEKLQRRVAIKVLPAELAVREDLRNRFEREAAAVSRLEHPRIVPIYELGEDNGLHFFAMRLVEGTSLSDYVRSMNLKRAGTSVTALTAGTAVDVDAPTKVTGGPEPMEETDAESSADTLVLDDIGVFLGIIQQTAEALHFAHENGIIHRDIKPSNIMVDMQGDANLLDFGLAMVVGDQTQTQSGHMLGTLPYMAPEQVTTRRSDIDRRTDVYGLGVTLYECISGTRPFKSDRPEALMYQIMMKDPVSPLQHNPDVSKDVATIALKCIEKDPARRYQTCHQLAEDLERVRGHRRIQARAVGRFGKTMRWAERNRALAMATVLLILGAVVFSTILVQRWAEQKKLENYNRYMADAERYHEEMLACQDNLKSTREDLATLEIEAPPHAPMDSPSKRRLVELRGREKELRQRQSKLSALHKFSLQRSREEELPPGDAEERAAYYWSLFLEAEKNHATADAEVWKLFLQGTPYEERIQAFGQVSIRTEPPGATAVAYPYEENPDGRLVMNRSDPVQLGATPVQEARLKAGSWMIELEHEGHHRTLYPVLVERDEAWGESGTWHDGIFKDRDWTIPLFESTKFDAKDWCHVPTGPYLATPDFFAGAERSVKWRWEDGFLIARLEETFAGQIRLVETPSVLRKIKEWRVKRDNPLLFVPRRFLNTGALFLMGDNGTIGEPATTNVREDVALSGISWMEAEVYAAWAGALSKKPVALPTSGQWQKAARGVDGRIHPWGNGFDWTFTNGRGSTGDDRFKDCGVAPGGFPVDVSPYGVMDMAGNVAEWCINGPGGEDFKANRWILGGAFPWNDWKYFVTWPSYQMPTENVRGTDGLRLARSLPGK